MDPTYQPDASLEKELVDFSKSNRISRGKLTHRLSTLRRATGPSTVQSKTEVLIGPLSERILLQQPGFHCNDSNPSDQGRFDLFSCKKPPNSVCIFAENSFRRNRLAIVPLGCPRFQTSSWRHSDGADRYFYHVVRGS